MTAIASEPTTKPRRTRPPIGAAATSSRKAAGAPAATPRKQAALGQRPARRRPRRPKTSPETLAALLDLITASLADDKAEEVVVLDLAGKASFADRMVIATGLADRQLQAMATHLEEKLKSAGHGRPSIEGAAGSDWVLVDAGDVVVHIFRPEVRSFYNLEKDRKSVV